MRGHRSAPAPSHRSAAPAHTAAPPERTANDRLHRSGEAWFWRGLAAAVALHFGVFALFPSMGAFAATYDPDVPSVVLPPSPELPPPPENIRPPADPVISSTAIADDVTIPDNVTWAPGTGELPPPPPTANEEVRGFTAFVPSMAAPRMLNREEVERALRDFYPPTLRQAGISHTVDVLLWLDEEGRIARAEVAEKGPYPSLDAAALKVVDVMRLSPALNRDRPVAVVVRLPVIFTAHEPR